MKKQILLSVVLLLVIAGTFFSPHVSQAVGSVNDLPFKGTYRLTCTYHLNCLTGAAGKGLDFVWADGQTLGRVAYSAADGTVTASGGDPSVGFGYNVLMQHANNYWTRYAHLEYWFPAANHVLSGGTPVGYMGSTGSSSAAHLHWHVYQQSTPPSSSSQGVDPAPIEGISAGGFTANSNYTHNNFDNQAIGCDNLSPCFTLAASATCADDWQNGYDYRGLHLGHKYHTYCQGTAGAQSALGRWCPTLPTSRYYRIYAFAPEHPGRTNTGSASYKIFNNGVQIAAVPVNQNAYLNDLVYLGRFNLTAGNHCVELGNVTGNSAWVAYDSLFWVPN